MAKVKVKNTEDLFYDTETGVINNKIKLGCNRNAIKTILKGTQWLLIQNECNYTLLNEKGFKMALNDNNSKWFKYIK